MVKMLLQVKVCSYPRLFTACPLSIYRVSTSLSPALSTILASKSVSRETKFVRNKNLRVSRETNIVTIAIVGFPLF